MSVINDTWRFLVQRRLWPVAILLIAVAAAVPMLLRQDPPPPAAAPAVASVKADKDTVLAEEPIVTEAADGDRSGRRLVLGSRKDPFKPQATPTPTPKPETPKTATPETGAPRDSGTAVGTAATPGTSSPPVTSAPVVSAPNKNEKKYELYELTVRFGASDGNRPLRKDVKRLQALPSNDEPVLIYLGVLDDKKTAVFLLDSGVVAQGDGTCWLSGATCKIVHIREGETEVFDVPGDSGQVTDDSSGARYKLDVIKIRKTTTTNAKEARQTWASASKEGRMILRARIARDGPLPYRYHATSGQLHKLSHKAYKALVAKAARAARAHF
jgi:hypothetical protein